MQECAEFKNKLIHIFKTIKKIEKSLTENCTVKNDLHLFKIEMTVLQEDIQNLKLNSKMNYEELKLEEKSLAEELSLYKNKLTEWQKPVKINSEKILSSAYENNRDPEICKEVKDYVEFFYTSSKNDGWLDQDHQLFIKLKNKYNNVNLVVNKLQSILPDLTETEIKKHYKWYEKYEELNGKKKQAIKNWQESKLNTSTVKINNNNNNSNETKSKKVHFKKDENVKEKITQWKSEKKIKAEEEIKTNQKIKDYYKEKQKQDKVKQDGIKDLVIRWKTTKIINDEEQNKRKLLENEIERKLRLKETTKMIKQFQLRDGAYVLRKRKIQKKTTEEPLLRKHKMFLNVPSKVLEPTETWIRKTTKKGQRENNEGCLLYRNNEKQLDFIMNIPKLHVPEWRQNLN